jgi:AraC family transcriptional activator of pobA
MPTDKNSRGIPYFEMGLRRDDSFWIRKILDNFGLDEEHEPAHRHNYQEILWIRSGSGQQLIDERKFSVKPSTFYLIGQGQVHQFISGKDLEGYIIRFTNDFLPASYLVDTSALNSSVVGSFVTTNQITIPDDDVASFDTLVNMIYEESGISEKIFGRQNAIQQLLIYLLIRLERKARETGIHYENRVEGQEKRIYSDFLSLLESSYHKYHHLDYYATQVGTSKRKLSHIVTKLSAKSPKQVMIERLMKEARRLLIYTDFSLKEITYHLGYNDPAYFCRVFKENSGTSPLAYKTEHLSRR